MHCSTMFAQTNIISFTNASGVFITNATAIKIAENKLLTGYRPVVEYQPGFAADKHSGRIQLQPDKCCNC